MFPCRKITEETGLPLRSHLLAGTSVGNSLRFLLLVSSALALGVSKGEELIRFAEQDFPRFVTHQTLSLSSPSPGFSKGPGVGRD